MLLRIVSVLSLVVGLIAGSGNVRAQSISDIENLQREILRLERAEKHREALAVGREALNVVRRGLGVGHDKYARILGTVSRLHQNLAQWEEAEQTAREALALREQYSNGEVIIEAIATLVPILRKLNKHDETEPFLRRCVALSSEGLRERKDPKASNVSYRYVRCSHDLRDVYLRRKDFASAIRLAQDSAQFVEKTFGTRNELAFDTIHQLAEVLARAGQDSESEYMRALGIGEAIFAPDNGKLRNLVEMLVNRLGHAKARAIEARYLAQLKAKYGNDDARVADFVLFMADNLARADAVESVEQLREALAILETRLRRTPSDTMALERLAKLTFRVGQKEKGARYVRQLLSLKEKAVGGNRRELAGVITTSADTFRENMLCAEAAPLYHRAITIDEGLAERFEARIRRNLEALGKCYEALSRKDEALASYARGVDRYRSSNAPRDGDYLRLLSAVSRLQIANGDLAGAEKNLRDGYEWEIKNRLFREVTLMYADLLLAQRRFREAREIYNEQLRYSEAWKLRSQSHDLSLDQELAPLVMLAAAEGDWQGARNAFGKLLPSIENRTALGRSSFSWTYDWEKRGSRLKVNDQDMQANFVRVAFYAEKPTRGQLEDAFLLHQTTTLSSEAAKAVAQMGARLAANTPELANIARDREDLRARIRVLEARVYSSVKTLGSAFTEEQRREVTELRELARQVADLDGRLVRDFTQFTALTEPVPLALHTVQQLLHKDEALISFVAADAFELHGKELLPRELFVFVITKNAARLDRAKLSGADLERRVGSIRCGVDDFLATTPACADHSRVRTRENLRGFDAGAAFELYEGLFGNFESMLVGKRLMVVPAGPLQDVPLHLLVTQKPAKNVLTSNEEYRQIAWLVRSHATSVLPSISSLKSLRESARGPTATKPFIGFGNPLLDGDSAGSARDLAQLARRKQWCTASTGSSFASIRRVRAPITVMRFSRTRLVDTTEIRRLDPLPETADELCAIAKSLGATDADVRLGQWATEAEVKSLSRSGRLADYAVLQFATHGAVAGEISSATEAGLILSPPTEASEIDDGYLTTTEVAELKINAHWVVLSACNTAAGNQTGSQQLSGLARSFFYAGARALLVSHWAVDSNAAVKLTTGAFAALSLHPEIGRAEAVRRSIVALIDQGSSLEAHPFFWAPFTLVGEATSTP